MPNESWSGERFWVDIIEKKLYPPEAIVLPEAVNELIKNENFQGKNVLDFGCGTGRFVKLAQDKGANVIGIDISKEILKVASKLIKVKHANGTNLPFDDCSFDYVLSFMVLHVIEDLEKSLHEICRVLKPEGKFLLGIVHPFSEKWNIKTGLAMQDNSTYHNIEKRKWVFNLTDGKRFDETYIHRFLEYYFDLFSKFFIVKRQLEPKLPSPYNNNKKYARIEYLIMELVKKTEGEYY